MNIEAYDADSLRKMVRLLEYENKILKDKLKKAGIYYEGDTQPIGIVLCADKGDSIVKYTLPEDNHQIFASKYFTYLPSEEELKRELNLKEFHKKE